MAELSSQTLGPLQADLNPDDNKALELSAKPDYASQLGICSREIGIMLQCELDDGRMIYVNMDRVVCISELKEGNMALGQMEASGEVKWVSITRFQVIKTGIWYK